MPLMCAAKYTKSPAVVELLLEAYADPNATDYVSGWDRDGVGGHIYGVTGRWAIVGCSLTHLTIDSTT